MTGKTDLSGSILVLTAKFNENMDQITQDEIPSDFGVAVSGGGDSIALLLLLLRWAGHSQSKLHVATVDHGLRDGSAKEAREVAEFCASLGVSHDVLAWKGWDGGGNLQSSARQARLGLLADWAASGGIEDIALGHTLDDQAETVLMRLARGSGVDGLSAMSPVRADRGVRWLRPMLDITRTELRDFLRAEGIDWIEDPSNDDEQFERVRVRKALGLLAPLGIGAAQLASTADRMASARQVLAQTAYDAATRIATTKAGAVFLDNPGFWSLAPETRRRLISHALVWVSNQAYPPRADALGDLLENLKIHQAGTLHGCLIQSTQSTITITREPNAVAKTSCEIGEIWDGRWRINGPKRRDLVVRATTENGLKLCTNWRETGLPRSVLLTTPAVWNDDQLLAAPVAGWAQGWTAELLHGENDLATTLLSH